MNSFSLTIAFISSVFGVAQAITLDSVLSETLSKNPAIQQARLNLEEASGHRLVLNSITWPNARIVVPLGVQGQQQPGGSTKAFTFARGLFTQPLVNAAIPPSRRLGDVDLLIAEQQLNVAVVEQLHAARLTFYSALYNRNLQSIQKEERQRFNENAASQKDRYEAGLVDRSAFTSAEVQARELDSQIESAASGYAQARLKLAEAMGDKVPADGPLPEPEGELQSAPLDVDVAKETAAALERRADIKLARLIVRAANEQQRIIEAGYYPIVIGTAQGDFIPVSGIHREGSTSRTDFVGSQFRKGAVYTWRVIDNGKLAGAVIKQRETRKINEMACHRLEANVGAELVQIRNNLSAIKEREKSLAGGLEMAEQNAISIQQNLLQGIVSELEYRQAQNASLDVKSGLLTASFQYSVALAEWDRVTGRYFQFSEDTTPNVR